MGSEVQYIDLFRTRRAELDGNACAPMNALREQAADFLARRGLGRDRSERERCRYTDLEAAFAPDYGVNLRRLHFPVNPYEAFRCHVPNLSTSLYFVVNDAFYDQTPSVSLPEGVRVGSLRTLLAAEPALAAHHYGRLARMESDPVAALNTLLAQDGLLVYIPAGVVLPRPLQVVNLLRSGVDLMVNRRVLIVAEEGAEATFLFCDHAMDNRRFLATQVVELVAGKGSRIELYELEETHTESRRFEQLYIEQAADSRVTVGNITLHNGTTCNSADIVLAGEGAETTLYGCVVADKEQHVDNDILVDHRAGNCRSDMLYKYVLGGEAEGAFSGRVLVQPDSQRTESEQTCATVCTSETAHMYSRPVLEIYADDVKCNHGSSVGQLDERALFYMRQRGIAEAEARLLLQHAFVNDVVRRIPLEPLRERLSRLIELRFRGALDKCAGCNICR